MSDTPEFSEEIRTYYERFEEGERLDQGIFQLEWARTVDILDRWLPSAPSELLDVGGGTGPYSLHLSGQGHSVTLIEPVTRHVDAAREAFRSPVAGGRARALNGDARDLDRADASADAVLLMGPLYHLADPSDRARALGEARRVLRPGGLLFAAAISRFASTLGAGMTEELLDDPVFRTIVDEDLRTGHHRNPTGRIEYFTDAYFHRPDELAAELTGAGFELEALLAIEGPASMLQDFEGWWRDAERRRILLDLLGRLEREPSLLGVSAHLMAIGRRP